MTQKRRRFGPVDILLILMMVMPMVAAMVLKMLFTPASDGIQISGALVYFTVHMPIMDWPISEAQVNSWMVIISILGLCLFLTRGLSVRSKSKRQLIAEWIVEKVEGMVKGNMGEYFKNFAPFVCAILALSAFSSLQSLLGLYAPTSDLNVTAGWAILVFALITYYKFKCGPLHYLKDMCEPTPVLFPINVISELATPISMAFRHYGNVLSGMVVSILVSSGLTGFSQRILGALPGFLATIPAFKVGIPAILSIYFDIFSGCLQAYIFAMLTMMYVSNGFALEDFLARKLKKKQKKEKKQHKSEPADTTVPSDA